MAENRREVVNLEDGYSASIVGGADAEWFEVNGNVVQFLHNPDFEMPFDNDRNNDYEIELSITQGSETTTQAVEVLVTDIEGDWVSGSNAAISVSGVGWSDSSIDGSTGDVTLTFTHPGRFTVTSIAFDGSTDLSYASGATNNWVAGTNSAGDSTLTQTFTYTQMVSATHEFSVDNGQYSTKWEPTVVMTEQIVVYYPSGVGANVFQRATTEVVPFSVDHESSIETSADISVLIQNEGFIEAVHAVNLKVENSGHDVEMILETIVNEPWTVDASQFTFTDASNIVVPNSMAIVEIGSSNCVNLKCTQSFKISFDTTSCNYSGQLEFTLSTSYQDTSNDQTFTMQLASDDGCVVDIGSSSLSGSMNLYDSTFTTPATEFSLEETVYVMATLTSAATIDSVTLSSFSASQDGDFVCESCQSNSDLEYAVEASDDASTFKFSFKLASDIFSGSVVGEATALSATLDISYTAPSTRRRLEQFDVAVKQVFSIRREPCGEDVALGYVQKTDCVTDPSKQFIRQCKEEGWEIILDQCQEAQAVGKSEAPKSQDNNVYYFGSGALILLLGGVAWGVQKWKITVKVIAAEPSMAETQI